MEMMMMNHGRPSISLVYKELWRSLRWLPLLLFLALLMPADALHAQDASQGLTEALQQKLGPARSSLRAMSFTCGHAKVTFNGKWAPLLNAERTIGYFLDGKGEIEYSSGYEPEWPVFASNAKEWTKLETVKSEKAMSIGFSFSAARLYFGHLDGTPWDGEPTAALDESFKGFGSRWTPIDGIAPAHMLAAQMMNLPRRPTVILEMEAANQRWIYRFDTVDSFKESLACISSNRTSSLSDENVGRLIELSSQPIGWDPKKGMIPTRFQLTALDIDLRTEDNRNASIIAQETLIPAQDGLRVLTFELMTDLFIKGDRRRLKVKKIKDGQGTALTFSHMHDHLAVNLAAPTKAGSPIALRFEYEGDFLFSPREDSFWQLGIRGAWFPQAANLSEESYLFHGSVRTKGEWIAFLPGDTVRREKDGAWNLIETRTEQPICFVSILGGKYFINEESRDGLTLRIATYGFKAGSSAKVIKDQAFNILAYYKPFLGPYPFKEFTIIEKNEWGYGQAPPSMTYITREAFEQISHLKNMQELAEAYAERNGDIQFRTMDVGHVLAHEIAHQYWGTIVKMPCEEDQWITESFADYCAGLYDRDQRNKGKFKRDVAEWKVEAEHATAAGPIPLANDILRKDLEEHFRLRTGLLYAKGPMLLHALHEELGDQAFLSWMKSIQTNFRWKFASTKRIFDLLNFMTKKDYLPFYETYYWGLAMPPSK
jgi:hypothetical protein